MQVNESQASAAERPGINHNTTQNRFELEVDGQLAHADYRREDNVLIFHHTWVPEDLRGKGHAAAVVRAGLEYARN
ncbi:MAG: N-acetyltransferase, partial [Gammaproteobacteria bacterium]|nr:N-acetyltransferase [Gammaproteobacteria bacterium]